MENLVHSIIGMVVILGAAMLMSSRLRWVRPRVVLSALGLQMAIALVTLRFPPGNAILNVIANGVAQLLGYAQAGTSFLFSPLAEDRLGAMFALRALPIIIFFSALVAILDTLGILRFLINSVGRAIGWCMGISRIESLCVSANIFVGQSESPLVIKDYLPRLDSTRLFMVMTSGMSGVAGTILAAYVSLGIRADFLLVACFMSAPASVVIAKLMMPDDPLTAQEQSLFSLTPPIGPERRVGLIEAASNGAQLGAKLTIAVGATVLAFVGLVALANGVLGGLGGLIGHSGLTFQQILSFVFSPVFLLLGMPGQDATVAGQLFGEKIILNEFVAFLHLSQLPVQLTERSLAILTFALCGFANITSIAIQMAVTGGLAPEQRPMLAKLGMRSVVAGSLANLLSAAIAGAVLSL